MRTRVAAVYIGKGGVGKSFISGHLAVGLAVAGRRVLAIDADAGQGHLSLRMGGIERRGDLLRLFREGAVDKLLQQHPLYSNLSVVTADPADAAQFAAVIMAAGDRWPSLLADRLAPLHNRYDYIIFDCAPGIESLVTTCVINAATELWAPVTLEWESFDAYLNLENTLLPCAGRDPKTFVSHVVPNKLTLGRERHRDTRGMTERAATMLRQTRTNVSAAILEVLQERLSPRLTCPIRFGESLALRTTGEARTIWETEPTSELAADLLAVVQSIVDREGGSHA